MVAVWNPPRAKVAIAEETTTPRRSSAVERTRAAVM
jgi:hypothetical protein